MSRLSTRGCAAKAALPGPGRGVADYDVAPIRLTGAGNLTEFICDPTQDGLTTYGGSAKEGGVNRRRVRERVHANDVSDRFQLQGQRWGAGMPSQWGSIKRVIGGLVKQRGVEPREQSRSARAGCRAERWLNGFSRRNPAGRLNAGRPAGGGIPQPEPLRQSLSRILRLLFLLLRVRAV